MEADAVTHHCNRCGRDLDRERFHTYRAGRREGQPLKPCIECRKTQRIERRTEERS